MEKLNEFENWILTEALELFKEKAEEEVKEKNESSGGRYIFAPGYFTMVTKDLKRKLDYMTEKAKV